MTKAHMAKATILASLLIACAVLLASLPRAGADSVLTTVLVGTTPEHVQLTPDGSKLFVSNTVSNTLSVISTATDTVIATVPVGPHPGPIRFTPSGTKAYVVNENANTMSVINVTTLMVSTTVTIDSNPLANPVTLSVTLDGAKVYVVNKGSNDVSVVCTGLVPSVCSGTDAVIGSIAVGTAPNIIAKTPDGSEAYVANELSSNLSVISTTSDSVVATIPLPADPGSTHFLPNGTKAYVASRGCSSCATPTLPKVSVINVATNTVLTTITVGVADAAPVAMRITPDGSKLYVVNKHTSEAKVISTATNTILTTILLQQGSCSTGSAGACPVRVDLLPDGSKAYVVEERPLATSGALTAICTGLVPSVCASTDTVLTSTPLGQSPTDLQILGSLKAYITNSLSNNVSVVGLSQPAATLKCAADIQESGKALDAHALCYVDSASIVNNKPAAGASTCPPADPKFCGDGFRGGGPPGCEQASQSPPVACQPLPNNPPSRSDCAGPGGNGIPSIPCDVSQYQYLHVDKAAHLLGVLNNSTNNYELYGCLADPHGHQALGAVYVEVMTISQVGKGSATIWPNQPNANCVTAASNHSTAGLSGTSETAVVDVIVDNPGTKPASGLCSGSSCRDSDSSGPCTPATCLDSTGDGCWDKDKLSGTASQGGKRDPLNPFDYPDMPVKDHKIRINDVSYVIARYRHDMNTGPQVPAYDPLADHTIIPGSNAGETWHLGPPNGQIRIDDVTAVINSYRNDCN